MPRQRQPVPGKKRRPPAPEMRRFEASVVEGLETVARREMSFHLDRRITLHRLPRPGTAPGVFRFDYTGGLRALLRMKTVQAIYLVRFYDIPRPRALLGDEAFRLLLEDIALVRAAHPPRAFETFFVSAAGETTAVMKRLRAALGGATGLQEGFEEGDLLLRLRRPPDGRNGWEVLLRISPRPLATRAWRVCDMEGALNATVAHAMVLMTDPRPFDVFLNVGCGSGTFLVERLAAGPARRALGCDTSPEALACARENLAAAGCAHVAELHDWDARQLPLEAASVDALCADLPFGHLVGSHADNETLYPALLAEAARVARPGALFALITHEVRLIQTVLGESSAWRVVGEQRIALGGLNPRIFVLQRA